MNIGFYYGSFVFRASKPTCRYFLLIEPYFKLEDATKYPFYWKSGNRVDIETTLRTHSDGTFLVRLARDRSLCLSVKVHKVYHLKLVEEGISNKKIQL